MGLGRFKVRVSAELGSMFAVTLRMHRRLDICRLYVPWMQISVGVIKQLEVGLGRFKVVMLRELAIRWGG